ncbi:hypothetical protein F5148DRAFT_1282684 [Russula earlei]|uniref:Uncharacterized protein n=1 Tax=Russula earlei TaxID=71964 RepID=A0ACC0UD75_9AGAM|nr:hypothetical protein F5148DRAFT_1282684 [Russula earlei]
MSPSLDAQQIVSSLAGITPFLWPFLLLSLGVALAPMSPLSWNYSTWLLFIIPLVITVFAPIRTFSGPIRYAYLEYASKVTALLVSLLGVLTMTFKSVPALALPAFFILPVLPILFFVLFPALPVVWHYISYHYRRRLKAVTTSVSKTTAALDLVIARARRVAALAHSYEKEALCTISTTRRTASLTLALHSTDFFDTSTSAWAALGHTTARTEELVTAARDVIPLVNQLRQSEYPSSVTRPFQIMFERANNVVTAASDAERLARMAQDSVGRSRSAQSQAEQARQRVQTEAERVRTLGVRLVEIIANVETQTSAVERDAEEVRAVLEQAVAVAAEGDMSPAEGLVANAAESLKRVVEQVDGLSSAADAVRRTWVELSVNT